MPHFAHTPCESPSLKKQNISVGFPHAQTRCCEELMHEVCPARGPGDLRNFAYVPAHVWPRTLTLHIGNLSDS